MARPPREPLPRWGDMQRRADLPRRRRPKATEPAPEPDAPDPFQGLLLVSVETAARALGIGKTRLYELIDAGLVESVLMGRRRMVRVECLRRLAREGTQADTRTGGARPRPKRGRT